MALIFDRSSYVGVFVCCTRSSWSSFCRWGYVAMVAVCLLVRLACGLVENVLRCSRSQPHSSFWVHHTVRVPSNFLCANCRRSTLLSTSAPSKRPVCSPQRRRRSRDASGESRAGTRSVIFMSNLHRATDFDAIGLC